MKLLLLLFILGLPSGNFQHEKFTKELPSGWSYKTSRQQLKISKEKKVRIFYCSYNDAGWEDTLEHPYEILIDRRQRLSEKELTKRKFLRDSLYHALEKNYNARPDITNASILMHFEFTKDKVDSLRLPFYDDETYSYFITDNFPAGHCFAREKVEEEIKKVKADIMNVE